MPGRSASSRSAAGERAVLWTVALACLLVPLNSTMLAVALPRLVEELDAGLASASWLVTGYLIAMAGLQPVAGRLGDRLGRRPLVLAGLVLFAAASAGAAAAGSLGLLAAFRVLQAVAGALFFPNAMALLRESVEPSRLGARTGIVGAAIGFGATAGPPLGGALLAVADWRWIFLVNLPLVAVVGALAWRALPDAAPAERRDPFDWGGAVLLTGVLSTGAWALTGGGLPPGGAPLVAAVALALLLALLAVEARSAAPLLPRALLERRPFLAASAGIALSNLAMYVTLLALPLLLARRGDASSAGAGGLLALLSAASLLLTPLGGRLVDRLGARSPTAAGLSLQAAALVPLALWPATLPAPAMGACLAISGAGLGLAAAGLQVAALATAPRSSAGVAAGVFSTSRYAGGITGAALLAGPLAPGAAGTSGFGLLFAVLAGAACVAAMAATGLPRAGRARAARPSLAAAVPARAAS